MTDEKVETRLWLYAGRAELSSGKLGHVWHDHAGEERVYEKLKGDVIGGQYEVEVIDDTSVRLGVKYVGLEESALIVGSSVTVADLREQWAARDKAAYTANLARKREAKDRRESRDIGEMTLRDCQHTYLRLTGGQQVAFLAQIIGKVTARRVTAQ